MIAAQQSNRNEVKKWSKHSHTGRTSGFHSGENPAQTRSRQQLKIKRIETIQNVSLNRKVKHHALM